MIEGIININRITVELYSDKSFYGIYYNTGDLLDIYFTCNQIKNIIIYI